MAATAAPHLRPSATAIAVARAASWSPTGRAGDGPGRGSAPHVDVPFLDTPWVPPKTPRQAWYWLIYAVAGFVVGQLAATIFAFIAGAVAGKTSAQMQAIATQTVPPEWYVVSTLIGLWIGFVGAPWLASRTQGTKHFVRDLGPASGGIDLLGILIGIGGQILITVCTRPSTRHQELQRPLAEAHRRVARHRLRRHRHRNRAPRGGSRGTLLPRPVAESLVRLFTPLNAAGRARAAGVVLAVIGDGLLFGAAHGEWVQFAGLAGFGIVLAASRIERDVSA